MPADDATQVTSAQVVADGLAQFAIMATELGHAHGCSVQLRIDSAGMLIVAMPRGSDRHAATVVPWPGVVAHNGAVTAAMNAMVAERFRRAARDASRNVAPRRFI